MGAGRNKSNITSERENIVKITCSLQLISDCQDISSWGINSHQGIIGVCDERDSESHHRYCHSRDIYQHLTQHHGWVNKMSFVLVILFGKSPTGPPHLPSRSKEWISVGWLQNLVHQFTLQEFCSPYSRVFLLPNCPKIHSCWDEKQGFS